MADNPIRPIPPNITGEQGLEAIRPSGQPAAGFENLFNSPQQGVTMPGSTPPSGPSPMQMAQQAGFQTGTPTIETLTAQSRNMQDGLGTIGNHINQLQSKNHSLTRAQNHIIKRNLTDAHEHLAAAGQKLGVDVQPLPNAGGSGNLARFLGWVGHGQDTILSVQTKLDEMSKSPDSINAADMMVAQMKMNQGQNEVQFATMLLSKIVDTIKQIMQTQL